MSPTPPSRFPTTVIVTPHAMWRIRLTRELPRYLLQGLALAGLLASARFAIAPPRSTLAHVSRSGPAVLDRAAEGFAALFARRYLTWSSSDPEAHRLALAPFLGTSMEAEAGLQLPESGEQSVQWTEVVQTREAAPGEHLYTVATETDTAGLLYLSVGVLRQADGALALAGYPAFVGAPAWTGAAAPVHLREVEDPTLQTVVTRALRNYLERAESELDADLAAGALVSLPELALSLQSLESLDWSPKGRSVIATVRVRDQRGAQYTLAYELDVLLNAGRWEISAIQMNPTA
jgi:hypothetical protein